MRKLLVAAIYDKVAKLSAKSLAQTSSGKLITLVSADIFMIERGLMFVVYPWCSIFIYSSAMALIAVTAGWQYALITFTIWAVTMLAQVYSAGFVKKHKVHESSINDNRLKCINDLVVGIRTIKASAWEHHYLDKVIALRNEQMKPLFKYNFITSFGFILYQNFGMFAVLLTFIPQWYQGEEIDMGKSLTVMAIIFYLFYYVNNLTYYSMMTTVQFLGIL